LKVIGLIGLGAMGGSYAKHLLSSGYEVFGVDPDKSNSSLFVSSGGIIVSDINDLMSKCKVIILSLPTVPIFKDVVNQFEKNNSVSMTEVVIDMNTISLEDKLDAKNKLSKLNIELIDAPVSGTGAQAKSKIL